jgi:allantoin racemase
MPRALIVNPNTSQAMSEEIRLAAEPIFVPPWSCRVVNAPGGPESLESWRDYAIASVATMPLLEERPPADGIVLACFGDPGLPALKEMADVPVVGIAEAAMAMALLVGGKFGILAGTVRAVALMDALVRSYGLEARYAGTESLGMRVLDLGANRPATLRALAGAAGRLVSRGADVLVLGCAGLGAFRSELAREVPLAVVDPVDAGCRALRALVEGGLSTARAGLYARPLPQRMHRLEEVLAPGTSRFLERWGQEDPEVKP